jgi:hypothetical protein
MYYVTYEEYSYCITEPEDSDDRWAYRGDYGLNVSLERLSRSTPPNARMGWETIEPGRPPYDVAEVPAGGLAHLVVVEYSDGDTFGSSGYWCVAGLFKTLAEADACVLRCEGTNDTNRAYRPWDGYFAGINSVRVESMLVHP